MTSEYHRLRTIANETGYSPEKVAILEEAARLADRYGSLDEQFDTRMKLISAAVFSGMSEKALVVFAWCLGTFDANPELYNNSTHEYDLMWTYKWIVSSSTGFHQISLEKINELLIDFERRCQSATKRVFHSLRVRTAAETGDGTSLSKFWKRYQTSDRGHLSDCHACEVHDESRYLEQMGLLEESIAMAEQLFQRELSCNSKPDETYGNTLRPLMFLGREDDAAMYHKRGYSLIRRNLDCLRQVGRHIEYLARTKNDVQGIRAISEHIPTEMQSNNPMSKFMILKSCYAFIDSLLRRDIKTVKVLIPDTLPIYREDGVYATEDLSNLFRKQSEDLAEVFNQRNGNDYFSDIVKLALAFANGENFADVSHLYKRFSRP